MKARTYINEERQSLHHQLGFRVHLEWLDRQQPRIPRIDSDAYHPNVPGNKIVERERERELHIQMNLEPLKLVPSLLLRARNTKLYRFLHSMGNSIEKENGV
jgi:hypothetical protein